MKIIECAQYSELWWNARRGVPTASEMSSILTAKTLKYSESAEGYINELVGETFRADYGQTDRFVSADMARGTLFEEESRRWYEFHRGIDVQQVGFCLTDDGRFGCSPDGLVGDDGGFEVKNPKPETHVKYLRDNVLPTAYTQQVHGSLIVTGRKWWDFCSYFPGLPGFIIRVYPDSYTEALREALDVFWGKYQKALEQVRALGAIDNQRIKL